MNGKVYLVGAGPGHPELITMRGIKCLQEADVVLYDRLVHPQILHYTKRNCELIFAGKFPTMHVLRQEKINELLIEKALENKIVVRLKGGDPAVFGRVGEEAADLKKTSIPFEIVPGITSGIAASTYAGVPVTHREYGETFAVVTGHTKEKDGMPCIPWKTIAEGIDTIAFYMGVKNLKYNCEQLILHGKPKDTKVAVVQWGTIGSQKTVVGTLETISNCVEEANISNPAIVLVGDVVSVRESVKWFEEKPLFNQSILIAKASDSQSELAENLLRLGADVIEFPKFYDEEHLFSISELLHWFSDYPSFVFTTKRSIDLFFKQLKDFQFDIRDVKQTIYVHSMYTKQHLLTYGLQAEIIEETSEESLYFGDASVLDKKNHYVLHKQRLNTSYTIAMKHWLKHKKYPTVIFPNERSVHYVLEESKRAEIPLPIERAFCMGKKAEKACRLHGISVQNQDLLKDTHRLLEEIVRQLS